MVANFKKYPALVLALFIFSIFIVTCSKQDDREKVRAEFGEPDRIDSQGKEQFWRELWFYDNAGTGFEFRQTAGCGSFNTVYLNQQFFFNPDTSDSSGSRLIFPRNLDLLSPY